MREPASDGFGYYRSATVAGVVFIHHTTMPSKTGEVRLVPINAIRVGEDPNPIAIMGSPVMWYSSAAETKKMAKNLHYGASVVRKVPLAKEAPMLTHAV